MMDHQHAIEGTGGQSAQGNCPLQTLLNNVYLEACAMPDAYRQMEYAGAKEYHQERWWREVQLFRLAPLTQQMTLNFIGQHVLGLPKSY